MAPLLSLLLVALTCFPGSVSAAQKRYVAPDPVIGISAKDESYLIGVISFVVVAVALVMAVASLMYINYDDDTLLMVEVPEDLHED